MGGWSLSLTFTPKDNSELPIILTGGSQSNWRNSLQMKKTNQEVRIRNLWGKCANHGAIMLHNHVSAIHNYYLGLNFKHLHSWDNYGFTTMSLFCMIYKQSWIKHSFQRSFCSEQLKCFLTTILFHQFQEECFKVRITALMIL